MKLIATMMLTVDGAYQGPGPAETAYMRIAGHPAPLPLRVLGCIAAAIRVG